MALDKGLQKVMNDVPGCVACGYVDMSTGMLLGVKTVDSHPAEVLELVGAATAELFNGTNISMIEKLFKKSRGTKDDAGHYVNEFLMMSTHLIHVMMRAKKNSEHAVVIVCAASSNLGMVLTKSRLILADVEASL
jgi:hypothetical protein